MSTYMFVHMAMKAREQGPLGAGVTGVCEKQNVGPRIEL